uniref:Ectopic P granules protein 5 n=1 Tax=Sphaerodactylus townsendi TaxID=933632 RepID=A0ACB8EQ65_9SAUR
MAEAVKPRSGAKSGRGRAKEKKKKREEPKAEAGAFLSSAAPSQGRSSPSACAQEECLTQVRLQKETSEREPANEMCDVPSSASALVKEGSPGGTQTKLPAQMEESGVKALEEEKEEEVVVEESTAPLNLPAASLGEITGSPLPCTTLPVRSEQEQEVADLQNPLVKNPVARSSEEALAAALTPNKEVRGPIGASQGFYPNLALELSRERPPVLALKPQLPKGRLYPVIPAEPELAPFTREQLKLFEPCSWLENVDSYAEEFEGVAHQDRHEFYELLLNYWRCRKQLLLAEAKLQATSSDCWSIRERLWTFNNEQQSAQGVCADQCKVSGHHRYQTVELNTGALGELKRLFEEQAEHVHQTLALHLYTSVLSRLQVESYIYGLLSSSALLRSAGIQQQEPALKQPENSSGDFGPLKECISVLFSFTRRVVEDLQFQSDILSWLQRLVSVLQRVGSPGDHLFLLNHILRCPAGVSGWAVPFIQIRVLGNPSGVFHFMQSLALLMSPAKGRAEFMCHMKPCERQTSTSSAPESGNWTLVDEGGEEDEDPDTSWVLLLEDDLIALLSQFPFHELFQHMLGFDSKGVYAPEKTTPHEMMKVFAFANSLVELLAVGLETFNRARYRQFVKRIGRLIRMTLCHVSDHWAQYLSCAKNSGSTALPYSVEKLQVEFDELFLRAVLHVLKAKRLGVWLFMSEMPYGTLSSSMLWKLFSIMHCAESENPGKLCATMRLADCKRELKDQ